MSPRRLNIPLAVVRVAAARGRVTQRRRYLARVRALVEEHVYALTDRVPIEELVESVAPVYQQAYQLGYRQGCRVRQRRARRAA